MDHDARSQQDAVIYEGKPISPQELFALGEKADSDQIDLIVKKDGKMKKWGNFKKWHTDLKQLPELILSSLGDLMSP